MSGIAAVIRFDGGNVEPGIVESMTGAMAYRGPDGINSWVSGPVALGHCMMRTTEESLTETQPLLNEDESVVVVFDGYLSNWEELRQALLDLGVRLRTKSDAELVLRAYEVWGEDCPKRIDGEYAFLVWDQERQEVFCARDHLGLRPIFYHWDGSTFFVASEVGAICAALEEPPCLNLGFMAEIMSDQCFTRDETVWSNVKRLLPAHWMRVSRFDIKMERYWSLQLGVRITFGCDEEYFEAYRELLADCVRRASRTHLPLACEVSGGLDSSGIFGLAHHLLSQGKLVAPEIKGYTLRGDPGSPADEVEYARSVGRHLGAEICEVGLCYPDWEWFRNRVIENHDLPPYPNSADLIDLFAAQVQGGCRVSLNGQGGDQWLDGTGFYYHELLAETDWPRLFRILKLDISVFGFLPTLFRIVRFGLYPFIPDRLRAILRKVRTKIHDMGKEEYYWISPELRKLLSVRISDSKRGKKPVKYDSYKLGKLEYAFMLHNLDLFSRLSAQSGVEPRSPMFSRKFIEFSASTPEHIRRRGGVKKFIHRHALSDLLPDIVTNRTSKAEFSIVFDRHLEQLEKLCVDILPRDPVGLVDPLGVDRLFRNHCAKEIDEHRIWELWAVFGCTELIALKRSIEKPRIVT